MVDFRSNWEPVRDKIGYEATGFIREFFLDKIPQEGTIRVEVKFINELNNEITLGPRRE